MLDDLLGMDHLVAMVGCPCLRLDEPLKGFPQRDLLLLAEDDPFMRLSPDLGCNAFSNSLVSRASGSDDGLVLELELNVPVLRVCPADQRHPCTGELFRHFPRELPATVVPVGQRSLGGERGTLDECL